MRTALFANGKKFSEFRFRREDDFERLVVENYKLLFGERTVYIDVKNKAEGKTLGNTIPDGLLFDLSDKNNPEFYLVEVELAKHNFYRHIFPQITKFFAFYKNTSGQNKFIENLHRLVKNNKLLHNEFMKYLHGRELYKSIKDAIENSQNILLILDDDKEEIYEVQNIYTDTWGKMVKVEILKKYYRDDEQILTLTPDFEEVELIDTTLPYGAEVIYTEEFHIENVSEKVKSIYKQIKSQMLSYDDKLIFNPQKYYVSIKKKKNFAYIKLRKKKMKIVVMLPLRIGKKMIKKHRITETSKGVQAFYGGECFNVYIENEDNLEEVVDILKKACDYKK